MIQLDVHVEGTFTVVAMRSGQYEAHVRLTGGSIIRIGQGVTPGDAITDALK